MAQAGMQFVVRTNPTSVFIEALGINGSATDTSIIYNIPGVRSLGNAVFKGVSMIVTQVCAYEVDLWASSIGQPGAVGASRWLGSWGFAEASFQRFGGAGLYYANIYGIEIPYYDADFDAPAEATPTIHASLTNRSPANTKSAGAPGALQVAFFMEPIGSLTV